MLRQERPAVERIDDQAAAASAADFGAAHQEVSGEVDAVDMESRAPGHLHIDDAERDRDAGAAVEHFVETAVPWILVLLAVPDEVHLLEQVLVDGLNAGKLRRI